MNDLDGFAACDATTTIDAWRAAVAHERREFQKLIAAIYPDLKWKASPEARKALTVLAARSGLEVFDPPQHP